MNWLGALGSRYRVSGDPLRTLRRIELLAVLLGLLLCLQLVLGGLRLATLSAPDPVMPAADSLRVPPVLSPASVAASERNEIVSRPLFWSSRRPIEEVVTLAEPGAKAGELKGVKLVGLFGSGERAGIIALVKGEKRRILLGDAVEGWTLESVTPVELVVTSGDRTQTLALERGKITTPPASKSGNPKKGRVGEVPAYPGSPTPPAGGGAEKPGTAAKKNSASPATPGSEDSLSLGN